MSNDETKSEEIPENEEGLKPTTESELSEDVDSSESEEEVEQPNVSSEDHEHEEEPQESSSSVSSNAMTMTAGQRLAAQKAAKAAKKIEDKQLRKEKEEEAAQKSPLRRPSTSKKLDETEVRILETRTYVASHSKYVMWAAAGIAAIFCIWLGFDAYRSHQEEEAGRILWKAIESARAEIRATPDPENSDQQPVFRTVEAKQRETLRLFRKVLTLYPNSNGSTRARLGIAAVLFQQQKWNEAKQLYQAAFTADIDDPTIKAQALEGLGLIALEQQKWSEAKQKFDQLKSIDNRRFQYIANYLLARLQFEQGKRDEAKQSLQNLINTLDESDSPDAQYVQQYAELLLQQIDPSTARPRQNNNFNFDGNNIPPELLEQLLRNRQGGFP